jgi:hypothetical protein
MSIINSRSAILGEEEPGYDQYYQVKYNGKIVDKIEIDVYKKIPEKPGYLRYIGRRKITDILEELNSKLKELDMLPDEYGFDLWNDFGADSDKNKDFPAYRWICCYPVRGCSEGHYMHIGVITTGQSFGIKHLFLAKTLREGRAGMDYAAKICKVVGLLLQA